MQESDQQLLKRYREEQSDEAFDTLVQRYLDLVYSAAYRQLRSAVFVEDVVQAVFIELARSASRLRPDTVLSAWLFQVTRRRAIDVIRTESRRQHRERLVVELNDPTHPESQHDIESHLDDAIASLKETDRNALLLRFFERKSLREVGAQLGTNEDAAQKRISRALDRLRQFFSSRKIQLSSPSLAAYLSAQAIITAPSSISVSAATVTTLATAAATTQIAQTALMTTLQKTLIATTLTVAIGTGLYQTHQAQHWKRSADQLQQERQTNQDQARQQQAENETSLAQAQAEINRLQRELKELPRMRGELVRLRAESAELAGLKGQAPAGTLSANRLARQANALKDGFVASPEAWIPELDLVTEEDWILAALGADDSEDHLRQAMSRIRARAEALTAGHLQSALAEFGEAYGGRFPEQLDELRGHLPADIGPAILARWQVAPSDLVENVRMGGDFIVTQRQPVDADFDTRYVVGPHGRGSTGYRSLEEMSSGSP